MEPFRLTVSLACTSAGHCGALPALPLWAQEHPKPCASRCTQANHQSL